MKEFICRHNIQHYRHLLESDQLDDVQRQTILRLLADEEALEAELAALTRNPTAQSQSP